ncbi:hypothetical protein PROFUN_16795, partial [Planoprotostelium fungivorum]
MRTGSCPDSTDNPTFDLSTFWNQIPIALRLQSPKNSIIYSEMRVSGSIFLFLFQLWTLAHSGCSPCETFHWAGNFTNSHTDKTYPLLFRITETLTDQSIRAMSGRDEQTAVTCADEQCSSMSSEPIDTTVHGTIIDTAITDSYRYSLMLLQASVRSPFNQAAGDYYLYFRDYSFVCLKATDEQTQDHYQYLRVLNIYGVTDAMGSPLPELFAEVTSSWPNGNKSVSMIFSTQTKSVPVTLCSIPKDYTGQFFFAGAIQPAAIGWAVLLETNTIYFIYCAGTSRSDCVFSGAITIKVDGIDGRLFTEEPLSMTWSSGLPVFSIALQGKGLLSIRCLDMSCEKKTQKTIMGMDLIAGCVTNDTTGYPFYSLMQSSGSITTVRCSDDECDGRITREIGSVTIKSGDIVQMRTTSRWGVVQISAITTRYVEEQIDPNAVKIYDATDVYVYNSCGLGVSVPSEPISVDVTKQPQSIYLHGSGLCQTSKYNCTLNGSVVSNLEFGRDGFFCEIPMDLTSGLYHLSFSPGLVPSSVEISVNSKIPKPNMIVATVLIALYAFILALITSVFYFKN